MNRPDACGGQNGRKVLVPIFTTALRDTQLLREAVINRTMGEIYFTTAQALRRCGVPGWGVFTNKALQGADRD